MRQKDNLIQHIKLTVISWECTGYVVVVSDSITISLDFVVVEDTTGVCVIGDVVEEVDGA